MRTCNLIFFGMLATGVTHDVAPVAARRAAGALELRCFTDSALVTTVAEPSVLGAHATARFAFDELTASTSLAPRGFAFDVLAAAADALPSSGPALAASADDRLTMRCRAASPSTCSLLRSTCYLRLGTGSLLLSTMC